MRAIVDILRNYLKSATNGSARLIGYAIQLGNSAVFKRLGFLLESLAPEETEAITTCLRNMKLGKVKFDPDLESSKLVTRWRLWVPKNWKQVKK
jgi:predicted transcriptional regulator of viral defense system